MSRRKFTLFKRHFIASRAGFKCEYCHIPEDFSPDVFNVEHIFPLLRGGTSVDENLAYACGGCNGNKHGFVDWSDPGTDIQTPLFNPRLDHWEDHFAWDDFYTHIIGLTPKARATIDLLKMNRPGLVNLRRALLAYGAHPDKGADK